MSTKVDLTAVERTFYGTGGGGLKPMRRKSVAPKVANFLSRENIFEKLQARPVKQRVASQLAEAMKKKKISKARMAELLNTSRSQVDRILDAECDVTLSSLQR